MNRKEVRTQTVKQNEGSKVSFQPLSDAEAGKINGGLALAVTYSYMGVAN